MEYRVTDKYLRILNTNGTMVKVLKFKLTNNFCFTLAFNFLLNSIATVAMGYIWEQLLWVSYGNSCYGFHMAIVAMGFIWELSTIEDREGNDDTKCYVVRLR